MKKNTRIKRLEKELDEFVGKAYQDFLSERIKLGIKESKKKRACNVKKSKVYYK